MSNINPIKKCMYQVRCLPKKLSLTGSDEVGTGHRQKQTIYSLEKNEAFQMANSASILALTELTCKLINKINKTFMQIFPN